MASDIEPNKLSSPVVYLLRMVVFLVIVAFLLLLLYRQLETAFLANPGLNALIFAVGFIGIVLSFRQVVRLFPEVRWVNSYRYGEPGLEVRRQPVLLAPMATLLGDRLGQTSISTSAMRSLLDSIANRLDEAREISRYMTGLLVFLGLLGTFYGLISTVSSVGNTIQALDVGSGSAGVIFEDLKAGLQAPLAGMGTAFSSSLFGLAGSLILGFLDLQAGQAQNRFYLDLEDWLSTQTELDDTDGGASRFGGSSTDQLRLAIERLTRTVQDGGGRLQSHALANLAEGVQGLVQHMRAEQQLVRSWADAQAEQQKEIRRLLELLTGAVERTKD
ncbi:flagellar motor protein MotA [Chthonobacter rhizosphaerae]|uniref:flagellar motor protein MotA n=1 Tax=Chthonobacter rhizosphaerae TaxID=2735553 RepID=UPI0015EF526D|nr:flagellar motor protein MotA [Chthonobacter rhizosphaerae]